MRTACFQGLLPLAHHSILRELNLSSGDSPPSPLIISERQLAWLAFHFPYLERLNGDTIHNERFFTRLAPMADAQRVDALDAWTRAQQEYRATVDRVGRNAERIEERMKALVDGLKRSFESVSQRKEGRRELVLRMLEQSQTGLAEVKRLRSEFGPHSRDHTAPTRPQSQTNASQWPPSTLNSGTTTSRPGVWRLALTPPLVSWTPMSSLSWSTGSN